MQSNVQGGTVTAASLAAGTVSGGSVTVTGAASAALVSGGSLWVGGVASLNAVSGGTLALNDNSAISTFNGGAVSLLSGKTLTVNQGSSAGSVSGSGASLVKEGVDTLVLNSVSTGNVLVSAGTLSAVTYAQDSLLTVAAGQLIVSGSGLTLGTLFNSSSAVFSGTSGTITLGSLNGSGTTTFASNATINSSVISDGTISANSGRLQLTTLSGGSVRASNLVLSTLSGGQATAISTGSIGTMSAGALALTGGGLTLGSLTGGTIALSNATLSVNSGSYAGSLVGTQEPITERSPAQERRPLVVAPRLSLWGVLPPWTALSVWTPAMSRSTFPWATRTSLEAALRSPCSAAAHWLSAVPSRNSNSTRSMCPVALCTSRDLVVRSCMMKSQPS